MKGGDFIVVLLPNESGVLEVRTESATRTFPLNYIEKNGVFEIPLTIDLSVKEE
jgi:hypothetical protein